MAIFTLNDKQYEFMAKHHETVELGVIMLNFFYDDKIIRELDKNQEYSQLMGDMGWDDVIDRYEDHPNYDKSFRLRLAQQFIHLKFGEAAR